MGIVADEYFKIAIFDIKEAQASFGFLIIDILNFTACIASSFYKALVRYQIALTTNSKHFDVGSKLLNT